MLIFKFLTEILVSGELGISITIQGKATLVVITLLGFLLYIAHDESGVLVMCHPIPTNSVGRQTPCGLLCILQRVKSTNIWKM